MGGNYSREAFMNFSKVTMVRVYIIESSKLLKPLMQYLQGEAKTCGASVFRAMSGYGKSGERHLSFLTDLSLDSALIVEFFDEENKIQAVLEHLNTMVKANHIVFWNA